MKKVFLIAGICIVGLFGVQAQQAPMKAPAATSNEPQVDKMMKNITSACNLTPDQITKVKPLVVQFFNDRKANKEKYGSDQDKMKEANRANGQEMKTKINAILTPEQQQKWEAFQKQKDAEKKGGPEKE